MGFASREHIEGLLVLPIPPSANALHTKSKRRSQKYKSWLAHAGLVVQEKFSRTGGFKKLRNGNAWYRTEIYWPADDPADADNRTKALHDLLHSMQVTPDDKWLWGSSQTRSWYVKAGTCAVKFWTIDEAETKTPLDA